MNPEQSVRKEYRGAYLFWGDPIIPGCWIVSGKGRRGFGGIPRDSRGRVMGRISVICIEPSLAWENAWANIQGGTSSSPLTLEQLREQAREAARVQALRKEEE